MNGALAYGARTGQVKIQENVGEMYVVRHPLSKTSSALTYLGRGAASGFTLQAPSAGWCWVCVFPTFQDAGRSLCTFLGQRACCDRSTQRAPDRAPPFLLQLLRRSLGRRRSPPSPRLGSQTKNEAYRSSNQSRQATQGICARSNRALR